jgi:hypothetical protein
MLQAAAGSGGASLDIPDVFSTYLYTGNGGTQTVTNGIDLAGEGGMVWAKSRDVAFAHMVVDTVRGGGMKLEPQSTAAQSYKTTLTGFTSSGFTVGSSGETNWNNDNLVSWSFLKAAKFFDVQTWTGDGTTGRQISHNLAGEVGTLIIKKTSATGAWIVYHRSLGTSKYMALESTSQALNFSAVNTVTSTYFVSDNQNASGATYVAYIFAHNDGDGGFGPSGDQDIIKCGSFEGPSATVSLGFEPQWLLLKNVDQTNSDWAIYDVMRGISYGWHAKELYPNKSNSESVGGLLNNINLNADGFRVEGGYSSTYIYMAIRRGPLNPPTAGTEVFATNDVDNGASAPDSLSGFPVDMYFRRYVNTTNDTYLLSRLTGTGAMKTNATNAEVSFSTASAGFDYNNGVMNIFSTNNTDFHTHMWKRSPEFFDVVARDGTNNSSDTIKHNLGAAPELIITKKRNATNEWYVGHDFGATSFKRSYLEQTTAASSHSYGSFFHVGKPTDTEYFLDGANANYNASGNTYIDYLFATLAGISKVGSVSHSGSSTDVNCGFSNGARFVMLKRTDATGDWYIWDSVRGIIAGNDPYLLLNTTAAQVTNTDYIDPLSSGFQISGAFTDGDYLFYAIA